MRVNGKRSEVEVARQIERLLNLEEAGKLTPDGERMLTALIGERVGSDKRP